MIVALGLHIGKLIDENVPFFLTDCACVRADRSHPVRVLRCLTPATGVIRRFVPTITVRTKNLLRTTRW